MRASLTLPLHLDALSVAQAGQANDMDAPLLTFTVYGHPQPGGSKRAVPVFRNGERTGQYNVIDTNRKAHSWRQEIASAASIAMTARGLELLRGPLGLEVMFVVQRPQGHYSTGRNRDQVRLSAPPFPATRPDLTKLLRCLEDSLSSTCWRDDSQICRQIVTKLFGVPERAEVAIWLLK
jgi:Holliday junction resolvase RusA-like endonuclease